MLLADDTGLFLGRDFFPWMVLAFGAAMVVGNVAALLRPPPDTAAPGGTPARPLARAVTLIVVGVAASLWGLASLIA